jgi:hypothetical protein
MARITIPRSSKGNAEAATGYRWNMLALLHCQHTERQEGFDPRKRLNKVTLHNASILPTDAEATASSIA